MAYQMALVINKDLVFGSDKTNFPILFNENCSNLSSDFWSNISDTTSGLDIRFYDTVSKSVEYSREIVTLDHTGHTLESWIQIPILSSNIDTTFVCEVGGGTKINDTSLWADLGAMGIYHLQDGADSGGRDNSGDIFVDVTSVNGYISDAYSFDGTTSYIQLTSNMDFTSNGILYAVSAWTNLENVKPLGSDWRDSMSTIFSRGYRCPTNARGWSSFGLGYSNAAKLQFGITATGTCSAGYCYSLYETDATISLGEWHYVACTIYNYPLNTRIVNLYIDDSTRSFNILYNNYNKNYSHNINERTRIGSNYRIGYNYGNFYGVIDELRIFENHTNNFDSDWFYTEYANQTDMSSFLDATAITSSGITVFRRRMKLNTSGF